MYAAHAQAILYIHHHSAHAAGKGNAAGVIDIQIAAHKCAAVDI